MSTRTKIGLGLPKLLGTFDVESTGTSVENDRLVQVFIGTLSTETGEWVDTWEWLIDPGVPIPRMASDVHGFTIEKIRASGIARNPKDAVFEVAQRLNILARADVPLVAFNAAFDFTMLDRELLRHWPEMRPLMEPNDKGRVYDPVVFDPYVYDKAVDKYRRGKRKLVDIAAHYGVPVEANAHDAGADCLMTGRIAIKLLGHSRIQEMSMSEVHAKLIPSHRDQALGLADYWQKNLHTLAPADRDARLASIAEVRAGAGMWPMKPRPVDTTTTDQDGEKK